MISFTDISPRLLLLLVFVLPACGGDSFGDDPGNDVSEGPVALDGRVAKGIVDGAEVSLYSYSGGEWVSADRTALTDEQGRFVLQDIPSSIQQQPLKLVARSIDDTRMRCDSVVGCGEHHFGDWHGVEEVTLKAVLPAQAALEQGYVGITPVTHIAADWLLGLPRASNKLARASLQHVADLLGLEQGAAFVHEEPLDATSSDELEGASRDMQKQALMGVALASVTEQEGTTFDGTMAMLGGMIRLNLGAIPDMMLTQLAGLDTMLEQLDGEHQAVADAFFDAQQALSDHFLALAEGSTVLAVPGELDMDDPAMQRAITALDDLDHYLGLAGIDEHGQFLANLMDEFKWLYGDEDSREHSVSMLLVTVEAAMNTLMATVAIKQDDTELLDELPLSLLGEEPDEDYMNLTEAGEGDDFLLKADFHGPRAGQDVDLRATVFSDTQPEFDFSLVFDITATDGASNAGISNATAKLSIDSGTSFGVEAVDGEAVQQLVDMLVGVIAGEAPSEEDLEELETLDVALQAQGGGSLAHEQGTERIAIENGFALVHVDVPGYLDDGPLVQVELEGALEVLGAESANILALSGHLEAAIGAEASLDTEFDFTFRDMPDMDVSATGSVSGLMDLLQAFAADPESFLQGDMVAMVNELIDLQGDATLFVHDAERDNPDYRFDLDNTALIVRGPTDHGMEALTFFVTSPLGGYLFAGDQLVGVVRLDIDLAGLDLEEIMSMVLAVNVHLIQEQEPRHYAIGALEDIFDSDMQALIQLLLDKLGGE